MIRLATKADIPALLGLLEEILAHHHQLRPDIFQPTGSKYSPEDLEKLLTDKQSPIYVYEDQAGSVLGHLFLVIREENREGAVPRKILHIEDLCVTEQSRGQKVGQALYDFAQDLAHQEGCQTLTLDVWAANDKALNFYRRQGLTEQKLRLEKTL